MSVPTHDFRPPQPIGEPYRADPSDPAPFIAQDQLPASVAGRTQGPPTYAQISRPLGDSPPAELPRFEASRPRQALTPDQRFARMGVWAGVASIFVFNLVLGPVAVVIGIMAMGRGERDRGKLAIWLGLAGTVIGIALLVLVAVGVIPDVDQMLRDLRAQRAK